MTCNCTNCVKTLEEFVLDLRTTKQYVKNRDYEGASISIPHLANLLGVLEACGLPVDQASPIMSALLSVGNSINKKRWEEAELHLSMVLPTLQSTGDWLKP